MVSIAKVAKNSNKIQWDRGEPIYPYQTLLAKDVAAASYWGEEAIKAKAGNPLQIREYGCETISRLRAASLCGLSYRNLLRLIMVQAAAPKRVKNDAGFIEGARPNASLL